MGEACIPRKSVTPTLAFAPWIFSGRSCNWLMPTACWPVIDLLSSRTGTSPFLSCDTGGEQFETALKRQSLSATWKSPEYLVPACSLPQTSERMSVLGSLVFCLLYLVDQHYLCLVARRQVQLEVSCCFVLALCNSLQVYWCAFGNWVSSPLHKLYLPWVPSPEIPKCTMSPCSSARSGDVGSVSEQKLWKLIEKGLGNFSWYWSDPLVTGPVKHPATSEVNQCPTRSGSSSCLKETLGFQAMFSIPVLPSFFLPPSLVVALPSSIPFS